VSAVPEITPEEPKLL